METRKRTKQQVVQGTGEDVGASFQTSSTSKQTSSKEEKSTTKTGKSQSPWIRFAIASGTCAAINGVFAKLTTTSLTSTLSLYLSAQLLGLPPTSTAATYITLLLRGSFLGLNILFNAVMWGLYTTALKNATSTTQVSAVNVLANFVTTALLGWVIFSEELSLQWWIGAAMLAAGNVLIGKGGEGGEKSVEGERMAHVEAREGEGNGQSTGVSKGMPF